MGRAGDGWDVWDGCGMGTDGCELQGSGTQSDGVLQGEQERDYVSRG